MHVAIIMDGNGRWALRRGLPRSAGHRAGAKSVDAVVEAAARAGINTLSLYAFSAANWHRPQAEVNALMLLFRRYLRTHTQRCLEQSIRLNVIGRRDRLDVALREAIEHAQWATSGGRHMNLRIAVDYSAQHSMIEAGRRSPCVDASGFLQNLAAVDHCSGGHTEVDLLIRTGGEMRLSDFLLWECAYAELYFTECLWPDFTREQFEVALREFAVRRRTFGHLIDTQRRSHA
jgi:undecaprenyl diphosphate synthase